MACPKDLACPSQSPTPLTIKAVYVVSYCWSDEEFWECSVCNMSILAMNVRTVLEMVGACFTMHTTINHIILIKHCLFVFVIRDVNLTSTNNLNINRG